MGQDPGQPSLRRLRGAVYRVLPGWGSGAHRRRVIGFARRWGAEAKGWSQEEFFRIFRERLLGREAGGLILELAAGDGLVGSLGNWLEQQPGWKAICIESRPGPAGQLKKFRATTRQASSLNPAWIAENPRVVTARTSRDSSAVVRALRNGKWRPELVGLWNRSGRDLWFRRMCGLGYRLALCQDRMEFYRKSEVGSRGSGVGGRESGG